MDNQKQIEIRLSKLKLVLMLLGCILFIGAGILFLYWVKNPPDVKNSVINKSIILMIIGLASISFFGFIGIFILLKLGDNSPGLIISNNGITDNSGAASAGLILWEDIIEIKVLIIARQKILMLIVKNPEEYINKQTSIIRRKAMEMNYRIYGSPIQIVANGLQCNYVELKELIESNYKKYHI